MLDYSVKLTERPGSVVPEDLETLRQAGFGDEAILHVAEITAYYAFANRIADGLGIELEDFWTSQRQDSMSSRSSASRDTASGGISTPADPE